MYDELDRRRFTRISLPDDVMAVSEHGALYELRLEDVSRGGFLVRSPFPYPLDAQRLFRFSTRTAGWFVELRGQAVYSHPRTTTIEKDHHYLTGFAFVNPDAVMTARRIEDLMARAAELQAAQSAGASAAR